MVPWVDQAGFSWVILLLCVALAKVTHWCLSGVWCGGPAWLCSHDWVVGRPAFSGSSFPCTARASADGLSARVVGFLTWQPGIPTMSFLGEEAEADRLVLVLFLLCSVDRRTCEVLPGLGRRDTLLISC